MGATSLRVCSSYSSLNTTFTDDLGTTTQLAYTSRLCSAGTLGQPGDSGGGVFLETTGGNLSARASVVAGGVKAIPQPAMCFRQDHKRQTIMSFFNATVVTS